MCGELAGEPAAVPILVGLGVDELSMNPGSIPRVKDLIRKLEFSAASRLAQNALQAERVSGVRSMAGQFLSRQCKRNNSSDGFRVPPFVPRKRGEMKIGRLMYTSPACGGLRVKSKLSEY